MNLIHTPAKRLGMLVAASVIGLGLAMTNPAAAFAIDQPVITNPRGNLPPRGQITVSLSGLTSGTDYTVGICDGTGQTGRPLCDTQAGYYSRFTASSDTAQVSFTARSSFTSTHSDGGQPRTVNCKGNTGTQCFVVITPHTPPYGSAATEVTFNS